MRRSSLLLAEIRTNAPGRPPVAGLDSLVELLLPLAPASLALGSLSAATLKQKSPAIARGSDFSRIIMLPTMTPLEDRKTNSVVSLLADVIWHGGTKERPRQS